MATEASAPTPRWVKGSCHCKAISYEANIPKEKEAITKCNCTVCQKPGFISIPLASSGQDFKLQTPSSSSEVKYYQYRSKDCYRFFCDQCGIQVWSKGAYSFDGKDFTFFSVNANTLDQPQDGLELSGFTVNYVDGLTDGWMKGTQDKPWSGGLP